MPDAESMVAEPAKEHHKTREARLRREAAESASGEAGLAPAPRAIKIMPPDEFVAAFFIQNAGAISARSGEPNPINAMAEVAWKAYRAYLITVSDAYFEYTKAHDMDTTTQFISRPKVWPAYDIATGATK